MNFIKDAIILDETMTKENRSIKHSDDGKNCGGENTIPSFEHVHVIGNNVMGFQSS